MPATAAVVPQRENIHPQENARPHPASLRASPGEVALGRDERVHGEVRPAEIRAGDPISCRVGISGGREREVESQVWRLSPLGVELVRPRGLEVAPGTRIDLTLRLGRDVAEFRGLAVASTRDEGGRPLVAARFRDAESPRGDPGRLRGEARWRCAPEYVPTGIAPNALRYEDHVLFRVAEISRTGMRLVTSLRNKFLVPGATFDATCSFPTVGEAAIAFRVVHARVADDAGKQVLSVGVTWSGDGPRTAEVIGQYLLQFGPGATLAQLRAEGFRVRATSRAFDFGSVYTDDEYREVLALRRLAYVHAGKASEETRDEDMADAFDARSRIVFARYRGRMVGTIRVAFPRDDADRLKHEDFCALPRSLPPRTQIVEMSKACTHPDFRGADLFYSTIKQGALVAMQARRRYILMSCTDTLLPVYLKLGFRRLEAEYVHPTMRMKHHVLLGDVAAMVAGRMNPIMWHVAIGPELWAFANLCGVVPRSRWRDARVKLLHLLEPVLSLVRRRALAGRGGAR